MMIYLVAVEYVSYNLRKQAAWNGGGGDAEKSGTRVKARKSKVEKLENEVKKIEDKLKPENSGRSDKRNKSKGGRK